DDPALDDGFYWMFSSQTGEHPFEATASQYGSQTRTVDVDADDATRADFELSSGHLVVSPTSISVTAELGKPVKRKTFTVTNDGTAPVDVEFTERPGGFVMQRADGSTATRAGILSQDGAPLRLVHGRFSPLSQVTADKASAKPAGAAAPHEDP